MSTQPTKAGESLAGNPQQSWSLDDEVYLHDSLQSLIDAHNDVLTVGSTVWVGNVKRPVLSELCDAQDVIDGICDRAMDLAGEYADGYPAVSQEAKDELQQLLENWLSKHAGQPSFITVTDSREYVITANDMAELQAA